MIKHYVTFFLFLLCVEARSQMADGSFVPNFTAKDINGNNHTLYDYLNDGKTVVLHFGATWSAPSWAFKSTGTFNQIISQYGPAGTDEMMVFFIEMDASTGTSDLLGLTPTSKGNWVQGTNYPIVNDEADPATPAANDTKIANLLQVSLIPTIYVICPNRMIQQDYWQDGYNNATQFHDLAQNCPQASQPIDATITGFAGWDTFCGGSITPVVTLQNLGLNGPLTNAGIKTYVNNTLNNTYFWNGHLELYAYAAIELPTLNELNGPSDLRFVVQTNNDGDPANNAFTTHVEPTNLITGRFLRLQIHADQFPEDISWTLENSAGDIIDFAPSGAYADETPNSVVENKMIDLGENAGCYRFTMYDLTGDGLCCGSGEGFFQLSNPDDNTILATGSMYESSQQHIVSSELTTSTDQPDAILPVHIYPNPAQNKVWIELPFHSGEYRLDLYSITGALQYTRTLPGGISTLDITPFQRGMYLLHIASEQQRHTLRLVLE